MKRLNIDKVSPQRKIVSVNQKLGNRGVKSQQGSTVIYYDTLPLDGAQNVLNFFENANLRQFSDTNLNNQGNRLGVLESLAIERMYLAQVTKDPSGAVSAIGPVTQSQVQAGELEIEIANNKVLKRMPISSILPQFNKNSEHINNNNFEFDTQIVIPPQLEFSFNLRLDNPANVDDTFIRLAVEGVGSIVNTKQTY